ncbi:MAG: pilus assembly protein [Maritimibacter sp.]|nr:pilus assembly protein [Maritimibacter sp.]
MKFIKRIARAALGEDGSATVEFVIIFPAIMTIFLSSFEVSIYLTRAVLLDRALDLNVRLLRLGAMEPSTPEELKRRVCDDALIFDDCMSAMMIELTTVSTSDWTLPNAQITCVDRGEDEDMQPAVTFNKGTVNDLMLVRACTILDPFFGTTPLVMQLPVDDTGGYAVAAASTFVNEP